MFGTLRTLLAFFVVLLHIFNIPTLGNYAVHFFYLLSGFLMTLIMNKKYGFNLRGFKMFWISRILRLFPAYWLILITTVFVISGLPEDYQLHKHMYLPSEIKGWVYNLTMIFPNIIPHRIEPRLIPPAWALTCELFFYLSISLGISKNYRRTLVWVLLSVSIAALSLKLNQSITYRYAAISAASLPFSLGALLYYVVDRIPSQRTAIFGSTISVVLFVCNGLVNNLHLFPSSQTVHLYVNILISFMAVYYFYHIKINKLYKIDKFIGLYSYIIYIIHYLAAVLYTKIFDLDLNTFKLSFSELIPYTFFLFLLSTPVVYFIDFKIDNYKLKTLSKTKEK